MRASWAVVGMLGVVLAVWLFLPASSPSRATGAPAPDGEVPGRPAPGLRSAARDEPKAEPEDRAPAWIEKLAGGEAATPAAELSRLFEAGKLSLERLLDVLLIEGLTGEAAALRERARARLRSRNVDLGVLADRLLDLCLEGDAHRRGVGQELLSHMLDDMHYISRVLIAADHPDADIPPPALAPRHLALVTRVMRDARTTPAVRHALLSNLGLLGSGAADLMPDARRYIEALWKRQRKLQDDNPNVRYNWGGADLDAARGMGQIGSAALPLLLEWLAEDGAFSRIAQFALESMGADALPALTKAARHTNPLVRKRAVEALQDVEVQSPELLETIRLALHDEDEDVRKEAAAALVGQGEAAYDDIRRVLQEPGPGRGAVLYELAWGGSLDIPEALHPDLLKVLRKRYTSGTWVLPKIAEEMGAAAAPATIQLLDAIARRPRMTSPNPKQLIRALGSEAAPLLLRALEGSESRLHPWAAKGLMWLKSVDPDTQRKLVAWLQAHPESEYRLMVAAGAAGLADPTVTGILLRGLDADAWDDRAAAAVGIGKMGKAALPYLGRLADVVAALAEESGRRTRWWPEWAGLSVAIGGAFAAVGTHDLEALFDLLDDDRVGVRHEILELMTEQATIERAAAIARRRWPTATARQRLAAIDLIRRAKVYDEAAWRAIREAFAGEEDALRIPAAGAVLLRSDDAAERKAAADSLVATYKGYPKRFGYMAWKSLGAAYKSRRAEVIAAVERGMAGADDEIVKRLQKFLNDRENM